ncbi:MAG: response regulator [Caedimonadaceae bacterium]|nr:MAG: response regulator [Caedimonadaceae bacterium]
MKSIPPFFSPTEVIMIDDDRLLLNAWKIKLRPLYINLKSFDNPFKALQHIKESTLNQDNNLNLNTIHHQLYSSDRFNQISTIIVDYDMPGMNGLEVCRQITAPHIQKIMLTGAATYELAVSAFNEGIIHQFIQKDDPEAFTKIEVSIVKAQERYFELKSHDFTNQLYAEHPETEVLKDPIFVDFFENLVQEKQVSEYYLLDTMGSFLFLSDSGNPSALFVFNEETLEFQEDMIPELDRHTDLAKEIYNHQKAICFYPFNHKEKYAPIDWKKYVYPLSKLDDKSTYFWAYVTNLTNLDQSKIE